MLADLSGHADIMDRWRRRPRPAVIELDSVGGRGSHYRDGSGWHSYRLFPSSFGHALYDLVQSLDQELFATKPL